MIEFRNTTIQDVEYVAKHMRMADVKEVMALGRTPHQSLEEGLTRSLMCVSACENDVPFIIYGMVPDSLTGDSAIIWALGTTVRPAKAFIEYAPKIIDQMHSMYPLLYNYVHCDNIISIRWLKRLGFEFEKPIHDFMRFSKKCVSQ